MLGTLTDRLSPDHLKARLSPEQLRAQLQRARHGVHIARVDGAVRLFTLGAEGLSRAHDLLEAVPSPLGTVARPLRGLVDGRLEAVNRAPVDGYDDMNVKQVDEAVRGLGPVDLERVSRHERARKNRKTVFRAISREQDRLRTRPAAA